MSKGVSVAMVEFSDYECPFCAKFAREIFPRLKSEYMDTGKIAYVVRDLPIQSIHPMAYQASEAAECAREQGRLWEMRAGLYGASELNPRMMLSLARELGVEMAPFERCVTQGRSRKIDADRAEAKRLGVAQTPTFLIGRIDETGQIVARVKIVGSQGYPVFKRALDTALSGPSSN